MAVDNPNTEMVRESHTHEPLSEKKLLANKFVTTMKKRARNGETVGQLHQAAEQEFLVQVVGMDDDENSRENFIEAATVFPQLSSIQASLYRAHSPMWPLIPATLADVKIEGRWGKTRLGGRFLLKHVIEEKFTLLIFVSD